MTLRVGLASFFIVFAFIGAAWRDGAAAAGTPAGTVISIPDGDFEQGDSGWELPKNDAMAAISTEQAASGTHSLKITDADPKQGSNVTGPKVAIPGEGLYEIRGQVFPVSGNGLGIYVRVLDKDGKELTHDAHVMGLGGNAKRWEPFSGRVFAPAGAAALQLWIHSYSAAIVTAYLDDLQFVLVKGWDPRMAADMQTIKQRLLDELLHSRANSEAAANYMKSLQPDGSWSDIDYKDNSPSAWKPANHMGRLLTMALAYRLPGSKLAGNEELKQKILSAYDFWMQHGFTAGNWWWNRIGIPQSLYRIMLLIEPQLSASQFQQGIEVLKHAELGMTGQNLVWVSEVTVARGCLMKDPWQVTDAFDRIAQEIRITDREGIQPDFSFYQHGAQLYSGGYGRGFSVDCPHFAALAHGTSFAFPEASIEVLSHYLLDGQQWMVRGQTFDYSACGREISRPRAATANGLIGACRDMMTLGTSRRAEFAAFADRIEAGKPDPTREFVGNKQFWRADFMTQHRPAYYASVRMTSTRLLQTESINGENLEGRHLADGVNYIFRSGEEYHDIFPVWDWQRLPGTTAEILDEPMTVHNGSRGERSFVGGVSNGQYGMAAMDFARGKLTAKKAWFFFDDEFVCLGAGINCPSDRPVVTTVNQCLLHGDVTVADAGGQHVVARGTHDLKNVSWVYHDGIGYLFPQPAAMTLSNDARKGSWWRINHTYSKAEISTDVFTLCLNHGTRVADGSYSYIVAPGATLSSLAGLARSLPVEILRNSPDLQAVRATRAKVLEAAFWKPGELRAPDGLVLGVDKPCLVLLRNTDAGAEIAVSNPENKPLEVAVQINRRLTGEGCTWSAAAGVTTVKLQLPDGLDAGRSVDCFTVQVVQTLKTP